MHTSKIEEEVFTNQFCEKIYLRQKYSSLLLFSMRNNYWNIDFNIRTAYEKRTLHPKEAALLPNRAV